VNGIYFVLVLPVLYALIAFNDWYFIRQVMNKHRLYLRGQGNSSSQTEKDESAKCAGWITSNMSEIKRRIKKSGIGEPSLSYMDPKGYGYVAQQNMSVIDNLLFLNKDVQKQGITTLQRVRGYYLSQTKRSLSPLFWIETLLFLPKAMLNASGIETTSKFADTGIKIVQLIYWLLVLWLIISKPELITSVLSKVKI
jgi:hypothetical protein